MTMSTRAASLRRTANDVQIRLRQAGPADAEVTSRVFYQAFVTLAAQHSFPPEPPSAEFSVWKIAQMLDHPGFWATVAERDGRIVGSAFVDLRSAIAGIGPVTVAPDEQDRGVGRLLMEAAIDRARAAGVPR